MLTDFLQLFNPLPGNHYIQISTQVDETTNALYEMMQECDGEFRLALYTQEDVTLERSLEGTKLQLIKNFKSPFRSLPRDNDSVIFKDIFAKHAEPELLLRVAYTTLANTADIVIIEKKNTLDIEKTKELLEKFEFRAPNHIEGVLDGYDVLTAKKMHMWGNGL